MLENNHFVIYEQTYRDSFENEVAQGTYTADQLKKMVAENTLTEQQMKILKDNIRLSGKYSAQVVEEIFNSAPVQRNMFKRGFDKLGLTTKAQTNNNLTKVYNNVWNQYIKAYKRNSALGSNEHTLGLAKNIMQHIGVDTKAIFSTQSELFAGLNDNDPVGKKEIGEFIYNSLKKHYLNHSKGAHSTYRLPPKV